MSISYYSTQAGFDTTLTLNNKGSLDLYPRVTLYARDGRRHTFDDILVPARSFVEVDLSRRVFEAGAGFEEGSLRVSYTGRFTELGGLLRMTNLSTKTEFDEQLMYPTAAHSNRLEAVFWKPTPNASARMVVTNTTGATVQASVVFAGPPAETREITLGPWQIKSIDLLGPGVWRPALETHPGAMIGAASITYTGAPGGVLARGFVADGPGYSGIIAFADPAQAKTTRLHASGVRVGQVAGQELKPWIVARNLDSTSLTLQGRVWVTDANGNAVSLDLPTATLESGSFAMIDAGQVWDQAAALTASPTVSLEFDHDGRPGTVGISAASITNDKRHVFRAPLYDPPALPAAGGDYFWNLDDSRDTVVSITNTTDKKQFFKISVRSASGVWAPALQSLGPHATRVFDIRALRDGQVSDPKGRTIPQDASRGQVHWSLMGGQRRTMIGRVEQIDVPNEVSSTYACPPASEDIYDSSWIDPSYQWVPSGQDAGFTAWEQDRNGITNDLDEPFAISGSLAWSSSVTSVAYPDAYNGGWFWGADEGYVDINAWGDSLGFLYWNGEGQPPEGHESLSLWANLEVQCVKPTGNTPLSQESFDWIGGTDNKMNVGLQWSGASSFSGGCEMQEYVTYDGDDLPFPVPFPSGINPPNPTQGPPYRPLYYGFHIDGHKTPGTFRTPYSAKTIVSTQKYQWRCPCYSSNAWQDWLTNLTITRRVLFEDSLWKFKISKTGGPSGGLGFTLPQ